MNRILNKVPTSVLFLTLMFATICFSANAPIGTLGFDDRPTRKAIENPSWFKVSFLDFREDVEDSIKSGKRGVMVYFGQKHCPYCKQFLDNNFSKKDIRHYTQKYFDVIGLNVRGNRVVTNLSGEEMSEKQFAISENANLTPTLLFINNRSEKVLKLVGYQAPYRYRAALEYVADRHYKKETFRNYLKRAVRDDSSKNGKLNSQKFISISYNLRSKSARPLIVMFEQSDCHACDILHSGPLKKKETLIKLGKFRVVQFNMWSKKMLLTPAGKRLSVRQWAEKLNINYAPTLIFYNPKGREVARAASVVHFYRLNSVLSYVLENGYKKFKNFRAWRLNKMQKKN